MTAITNHDKGCVITDKKFSELEKLGITVYFLPKITVYFQPNKCKGIHMILAEDGLKAYKAGQENARKEFIKNKEMEKNDNKHRVIEELIEQCRTYRGTAKPCFNENCRMKDGCLSYFGHKVLI